MVQMEQYTRNQPLNELDNKLSEEEINRCKSGNYDLV